MDVSPDVKYAAVPSMFIQPLVENAIRHGISRRAAGGTVSVHAAAKDGRLEIRVLDDGVGLPPRLDAGIVRGIGLVDHAAENRGAAPEWSKQLCGEEPRGGRSCG